MSATAPTFVTKIVRNWHCFDVSVFRTGVVRSIGAAYVNSWNDISLDDLIEYYDSATTSLLDRLAPSRTKTFRISPSNVWFDDNCKAAKRLSRMKKRKYLKTKLSSDRKDWIKQLRDYHKYVPQNVVFSGSVRWKWDRPTQRECGVPSTPFLAELSVQYSLRALLSISPSSSRRRWRKFDATQRMLLHPLY